jgi:hypothetical protein
MSRKKSEGILHESDNNIIITATDIKAKPLEVTMVADLLLCRRAKTEDIEKGSISIPPTIDTAICVCCANKLKPKEHFCVSSPKIVEAGTCDARAKKINMEPMIPALTASKG